MMEANTLSVIIVKSDSKGNRLLFRYPYTTDARKESNQASKRRNPYALVAAEDLLQSPLPQTSNIINGNLAGFSDAVLSTLFAVKPELCEKKFELKVNDVRFVGHPTLMQLVDGANPNKQDVPNYILVNIVFALHATASHSIVKCYYDFSKRLGIALRHEEQRCGYLSKEMKTMISAHDEVAAQSEDDAESPFDTILRRSALARDLKMAYEDLCTTGFVHLRINKWVEVSFCLPQKVHRFYQKTFLVGPEDIHKCLIALRPYHALLLLVDENALLESLPPDASPTLVRLINIYTPLKSLQSLALDADLTLNHVFQLAGHLVYWAKATIIYPLCESNVYVVSRDAPTHVNSSLVELFSEHFPGLSLLQAMSEFSLPTSLSQKGNPLTLPQQRNQLVQTVVWMLKHRILVQLHTYVYFLSTVKGPSILKSKINFPRESYQSTPDELSTSFGRVPSESDLSSNMSDDVIASPVVNKVGNGTVADDSFLQKSLQDALLAEFTEEEKSAILNTPAASNPDDLHLFKRLCHHFRGQHHLEEIMYFENVRRSQLLQLIDKFRDVLVTCEMEDPAIALFYSHAYSMQ